MKIFLIALPLCVLGVSCERHDFESTRQLHEKHDSHGAHKAGHDVDHAIEKKDAGAH